MAPNRRHARGLGITEKVLAGICILLSSLFLIFFGEASSQTLTVTKSGSGSGLVTSSPSGINCGSDCTEAFAQGKKIKLKAKADAGSSFKEWGGACGGAATSCTLTINGDQLVTATFVSPDLWGEWAKVSSEPEDSGYEVSAELIVHSDQGKASNVTVRVYLSADDKYDQADTLLSAVKLGSINANSSKSKEFKFDLATSPSAMYLIAIIDPDNAIRESNEGNNIANVPLSGGRDCSDVPKIPGADLHNCDLVFVNLKYANLALANLSGAYLKYVNLAWANLSGANLKYANLTGADLTGANLTGADLWYASLSDANLTDTNLTRADLSVANLTGADLTGADLTGTNLTGAILSGAIWVDGRWCASPSIGTCQ